MKEEIVSSPTIADVKKQWEGPLSRLYTNGHDRMANSFYYTLTTMMDLDSSKHILEVGCGRCLLLPNTLQIKNPEATYLATDLSEKMIEFGHTHLKKTHESYNSKYTYEEWLASQKLEIRAANGE